MFPELVPYKILKSKERGKALHFNQLGTNLSFIILHECKIECKEERVIGFIGNP